MHRAYCWRTIKKKVKCNGEIITLFVTMRNGPFLFYLCWRPCTVHGVLYSGPSPPQKNPQKLPALHCGECTVRDSFWAPLFRDADVPSALRLGLKGGLLLDALGWPLIGRLLNRPLSKKSSAGGSPAGRNRKSTFWWLSLSRKMVRRGLICLRMGERGSWLYCVLSTVG